MKQAAFIVSYLGRGDRSPRLYSKRLNYHRRQLEWLCTEKSIDRVFVRSQGYNEDEIRIYESDKISFLHSDEPQHPGIGRNVLLRHFYSTDYDVAHFIDNDSILYDHIFGKSFFEKLSEVWEKPQMSNVAGFRPIIPRHEPFTGDYRAEKELRDNNFVFRKNLHLKGSFFTIRNFSKYDNVEIFFDEKMFQMEDDEFAMKMLQQGLHFYKCENIVLNEMANGEYSVLFSEQDRMKDVQKWKDYIAEKYSSVGVRKNSKGNLDRSSFIKRFWKAPNEVVVPLEGAFSLDNFF